MIFSKKYFMAQWLLHVRSDITPKTTLFFNVTYFFIIAQ